MSENRVDPQKSLIAFQWHWQLSAIRVANQERLNGKLALFFNPLRRRAEGKPVKSFNMNELVTKQLAEPVKEVQEVGKFPIT